MASLSEPFIRRPVGTTLLAIGLFLVGAVAYNFLPVASIPSVDFPSIRVSASRPGADPTIMASTVAAPLERRLGEIAGIDQITSTSSLGTTSISLQFAIGRNIDKAARDVQAAINASLSDLPTDLPTLPNFRKANPAASPVLIIALTFLPIFALLPIVGVMLACFVQLAHKAPLGSLAFATSTLLLGFLAFLAAKLSVYQTGVWFSFGTKSMAPNMKNLYRMGYLLMIPSAISLLLLSLLVLRLHR